MDNSIAKNLDLEEKMAGMKSYASVVSKGSGSMQDTLAGKVIHSNFDHNLAMADIPTPQSTTTLASCTNLKSTGQNNTKFRLTEPAKNKAKDLLVEASNEHKAHNSPKSFHPDNQDGVFEFPKEHIKRSRRQELRRKVIEGSANKGGKVKGAPVPVWM